jgi:hypothetical protein
MMQVGENWECTYCGHAQVLTVQRMHERAHAQNVQGWKEENLLPIVFISSIVCANQACRELTLFAALGRTSNKGSREQFLPPVQTWNLLPASSAKPQPDCIPESLRRDYYEACAIRDLSPKASATIIRRCLQGMIRDFCGISKKRLIDEIDALRELMNQGKAPAGVQPDSVEAIDHVRGIGNIGAHMESDINVIIDVDPNEAQTLIELTELLFDEWYVAREDRMRRLAKLKDIAQSKKDQKQQNTPPTTPGTI